MLTKLKKKQTVANQPNRSNDQIFMLNTLTASFPSLSRPPLAPLNIADTFSVGSSNNFRQTLL